MLIDDDMVSREVLATILTMSGYSVHTAVDGSAALSLLGEGNFKPGVILMDAQMPGLSGAPLIEKLRAQSKARIYVISASQVSAEVTSIADGFLLKPFPPDALSRLLEEHQAKVNPPGALGLDPEETIVDRDTVAQLREMMPDAQVRQIFEAIVADLERRTVALEAAVVEGNWPEARRIGHAIKGGAAMAGAVQVSRLGKIIEAGRLEPKKTPPGINQVDNSVTILQDLRTAALNLQRILNAEFRA